MLSFLIMKLSKGYKYFSILSVALFCMVANVSADSVYPISEPEMQNLCARLVSTAERFVQSNNVPAYLKSNAVCYQRMLQTKKQYLASEPEQREKYLDQLRAFQAREKEIKDIEYKKAKYTQSSKVISFQKGKDVTESIPEKEILERRELEHQKKLLEKRINSEALPENFSNPENIKYVKFEACRFSGTEKEQVSSSLSLAGQTISSQNTTQENSIIDILFVKAIPENWDTAEVFGAKTVVLPVDQNKFDEAAKTAVVLGVKCLPTRLIRTNKARYWLEGEDAFKNYDKKRTGEMNIQVRDFLQRRK